MQTKKIIISFIACLVLSLSLFTFIACDDSNDSSNDNGTISDSMIGGIEEKSFNKIIDGFIAYGIEYTKTTPNTGVSIDLSSLHSSPQYNPIRVDDLLGIFLLGFFEYDPLNKDEWGDPSLISVDGAEIFFYDTIEHANVALESMSVPNDPFESYGISTVCTQKGNMIIKEASEGFYDKLCAYSIPEELASLEAVKFVKETFLTETHSNNRQIELAESAAFIIMNGKIQNFGMWAMPESGNREKTYRLMSFDYIKELDTSNEVIQSWIDDINDKIGTYYTDDSYAYIKTINNDKYVCVYVQPKCGLIFSESESTCTLTEAYFDGHSLNIPSIYNNKRVSSFDYMLNIQSAINDKILTDIYFDGTLEQWNAIYKVYDETYAMCNIHCTDGEIKSSEN